MSQESSATELEVAMLYSELLAESDDEDDAWLLRMHEARHEGCYIYEYERHFEAATPWYMCRGRPS